jgi:hypothetical protein
MMSGPTNQCEEPRSSQETAKGLSRVVKQTISIREEFAVKNRNQGLK